MSSDVPSPAALPVLDGAGRRLLFTEARTANSFAKSPVSDGELMAIWELATWAPTGSNSQPLRILFVRTAEGRARLLPHMSDGNRPKTALAPVTAVLARDTEYYEHFPVLAPHRPNARDEHASKPSRVERTSSYNAALQAGYFILAVRAQGLAAGPMGGFDHAGLDAEFFPDGRFRSTLTINIGHPAPDAWGPRGPRLAIDDVVRWA